MLYRLSSGASPMTLDSFQGFDRNSPLQSYVIAARGFNLKPLFCYNRWSINRTFLLSSFALSSFLQYITVTKLLLGMSCPLFTNAWRNDNAFKHLGFHLLFQMVTVLDTVIGLLKPSSVGVYSFR